MSVCLFVDECIFRVCDRECVFTCGWVYIQGGSVSVCLFVDECIFKVCDRECVFICG